MLDSTIVFNEIMYHGFDDQNGLEWIELHNQLAVDVDVSSWRLDGGVNFNFAAGTIVSGGGYLVVASDPSELTRQTGFSGALGPLVGQLSNGGEQVRLHNNNDRVMDQLDYDDSGQWPVGPDGSGFTLAKLRPLTASAPPDNWMTSRVRGGSPGEENFLPDDRPEPNPEPTIEMLINEGDTAQVFIPADGSLDTSWTEATFDASSWTTGPTGVGYELAGHNSGKLATDIQAEMFDENTSAFIRIPFTASEVETVQSLSLELTYSDGFVSYLNGQQIAARNAPAAPKWNSAATTDPPGLVTEVFDLDFGTTVISDHFDRAHSILDGSTTPVGGAQWTANTNFDIVSNRLTNNSANSGAFVPFTAPVDAPYTLEIDVTRGSGAQNHSTFLMLTGNDAGSLTLGGTGDSEVLAFSFHQDGDVGLWENNFSTAIVQFEGNNPLANPTDPTHLLLEVDPVNDRVRAEVNGTEVINVAHTLNSTPAMVGFGHSNLVPTSYDNFRVRIRDNPLHNGTNVLAIHGLNAVADDPQFVITGQLEVVKLPPGVEPPDSSQQSTVVINEVSRGGSSGFFVEIANNSSQSQSLSGYVLSSSTGDEYVFPAQRLAASGYHAVTEVELGFIPADRDNLFLFTPGKAQVADARRVTGRLRGRSAKHDGRWLYPDVATPGTTNSFDFEHDIVINEVYYHPFGQQPDTVDLDFSQNLVSTSLVSMGASAAVFVPGNDSLGTTWQLPAFDDSGWITGPTGVGFETAGLTDIIAYGNLLGEGGSAPYGGTYGHDFTVNSAISVTELGVFDSGADGLARSLTSRIWSRDGDSGTKLAELDFTAADSGTLVESNRFKPLATPLVLPPGEYTVTAHGYGPGEPAGHEGFGGPFSAFKTTDDGGGAISFVGTSRRGSSTELFPPSPAGGTANYFSAGTFQFDTGSGFVAAEVATAVASQMHGVNSTAYLRVEFTATAPSASKIVELTLRMKYDDGFIAYLNGTEVARRNAPAVPSYNSSATVEDEVLLFAEFDISAHVSALQTGKNVLAIHGLNSDAANGDFLIVPELQIRVAPKPQNEWVELYNRAAAAVDLTGWKLDEAVRFDFAPGTTIAPDSYLVVARDAQQLTANYPNIDIVGNFSGRLSNRDELVALLDAGGNPADEVHYYQDGYWPKLADGGGSSLELRSPSADNSKAEAWAASEEASKSDWSSFSYRDIAGPTDSGVAFHELVIGLLDDGKVLLDDMTVVEDPDGIARQLIQNSTFESDTIGSEADTWRIYGNHFDTVVIDLDNPTNQVLHLVATGRTDDMHNHGETTLKDGLSYVNITAGQEYEISFRAKWLGGSNQFHTRLFYNRVARTTLLPIPELSGTPGAQNSRFEANIGPTFSGFIHNPVIPDANEAVTVTAVSEDPDGVSSATVHWSAAGAAWQSAPMTIGSDGQLTGTIPGHSTSTIVQFYVEATDTLGTSSTFPAAGLASRALFKVQDNQSQLGARHNLRIIQTTVDKNFANQSLNLWSQHRLGATVVLNEDQVYYDASIRYAGRGSRNYSEPERGYTIGFHTANKFLGVHRVISVDRQLLGEMLLKHLQDHAGGVPGMYNDAVHFIGPSSTGLAMLRKAGFGEVYLDEQFAGGSDSTLFEKEMIYRPHVTTIRGDPESFKLNNPFQHNFEGNTDIGDTFYGTDKEAYRPFWLIKNNRDRDDYSSILALNEAFRLSGAALDTATREVIDVDQWLRVLATIRLAGVADWYSQPAGGVGRGSWNHNVFFYQRPTDGRLIMLPWDMDRFGSQPTGQDIVGNRQSAVADLILLPTNLRRFYGHFHDLINTTYNAQYAAYWASHYGQMFPGIDFQGPLNYIISRANAVLAQLPAQIPFAITSTDPLDVGAAATATIDGKAWIDAREIRLAGTDQPLQVTFKTDEQSEWADGWEVTLPLRDGTNDYVLQAYDYQGELVGTDTITVTTTLEIDVFDSLLITELNYNPYDPTSAEVAASFTNNDDFEFVELMNVSPTTINLLGTSFSDGIDFTFPSMTLNAGERVLVVKDQAAFETRYGTGLNIAGEFTASSFRNSGENVTLLGPDGVTTILDFAYGDNDPWPQRTDGDGGTLELIDPLTTLANESGKYYRWRGSTELGGSPGTAGAEPLGVVINEVLTHTDVPPPSDSIEVYNPTGSTIDIGGLYLSDSSADFLKFEIPAGTMLGAGQYMVFDENDFNPSVGVDPSDFALDGAHGDDVWLTVPDGSGGIVSFVDDVHFGATPNGESFGRTPDGSGRLAPMTSLTLGTANSSPRVGPLVVSEMNYNPVFFQQDFNGGTADGFTPLSSTWTVTGGRYEVTPTGDGITTIPGLTALPTNFQIDATVFIPADNGFNQNGAVIFDHQGPTDFKFASFHSGTGRWRIGRRDAIAWNFLAELQQAFATDTDHDVTVEITGTVARVLSGSVEKVSYDFGTSLNSGLVGLGSKNGQARFDDVSVGPINFDDTEFVELFNPTGSAVDLTDWRIRGGVDFNFDPGTMIGAGEALVVISFDPDAIANADRTAAFRAHYGIDGSVSLVGGYAGSLNNNGEKIELQRPDAPPPAEPLFIPHLLEDEVIYDDLDPWPTEADGNGVSLTRVTISAYGNLATSWASADPSPGSASFNIRGDMDLDDDVDFDDIDDFVLGLQDAPAYLVMFGVPATLNGDTDQDGDLDFDDIDAFVLILSGGGGLQAGDMNADSPVVDSPVNDSDAAQLALGLFDPVAYEAMFGAGSRDHLDTDLDGDLDFDDIDGFLPRSNAI